MKKITAILLLGAITPGSLSQVPLPVGPEVRRVQDPSMLIDESRTKIEIFPSKRVEIARNSSGQKYMSGKSDVSPSARIGRQPVLVFNHAHQHCGYATGEIAFKFKSNVSVAVAKAIVPGAIAVGKDFFVVNVDTPQDILNVSRKLSKRGDIAWVVPTIEYLPYSAAARQ